MRWRWMAERASEKSSSNDNHEPPVSRKWNGAWDMWLGSGRYCVIGEQIVDSVLLCSWDIPCDLRAEVMSLVP